MDSAMPNECVAGVCMSELDMFDEEPIQTQVESGAFVTYLPVTPVSDSGTLEFDIKGNVDDYVDVARSELHLEGRVVKHDGSNIVDNVDDVVPVCQLFHSIWAQADFQMNGQSLGTALHYPYKCFMDSLLNYSTDQIKTLGAVEMFYPEKKLVVDKYGSDPGTVDDSIGARKDKIKNSKSICMQGPLRAALTRTGRYLPNNMNIRLRFTRQKPEYYLMWKGTNGYKFVIDNVWLHLRHVRLFPSMALAHATVLRHHDFRYSIPELEVATFSIEQGRRNYTQDNLYMGRNPAVVIIGLVSHLAYNGDSKRNPFHFGHFDLSSIGLYVDGQARPFQPMRLNFAAGNFVEAYRSLHRCLDQGPNQLAAAHVTPDNYDKGYALYAFDLTPNLSGAIGPQQVKKVSNMRLELNFAKGLPEAVNCIHWAHFHNKLRIDQNRNVLYQTTI